MIIEQTGEEYDENRAPPAQEDFPVEVHYALAVYRLLPNCFAGMGSYIGKDYSSFPVICDMCFVDQASRPSVLEILLWLDNRNIKKAEAAAKKAAKK